MTDPTEAVRRVLAKRDAGLPHSDYDREDVEEMHGELTYADLRALLAAHDAAVAERDALRAELAECARICADAEKQALHYKAALERHGVHDEECPAMMYAQDSACDCGLTAARATPTDQRNV